LKTFNWKSILSSKGNRSYKTKDKILVPALWKDPETGKKVSTRKAIQLATYLRKRDMRLRKKGIKLSGLDNNFPPSYKRI
jgi:hypothetical protein